MFTIFQSTNVKEQQPHPWLVSSVNESRFETSSHTVSVNGLLKICPFG